MLQVNDLILLLTELEDSGDVDAKRYIRQVVGKQSIPLNVLKYVNDKRQLDVVAFYDRIRRNHNEKKSPLYKNIMSEITDTNLVLTTLHAFLLQVSLFGSKLDNESKTQFFKHVRAEEAANVLRSYYKDFDVSSAMKLLRLIKADIMAFEYANGRREAE